MAVAVLGGCGGEAPPPSVVLITLDTVRADRLGCYGYAPAETPNLDALAQESIVFEAARAPVPLTLPSHASIHTGRTPSAHGVHDNLAFHLPGEEETLAEILQTRGYRTGAVVGAFVLDSRFGLDQGFDHYDDVMSARRPGAAPGTSERPAAAVTRPALTWLEENAADPFFLWVHYYDPHAPYSPPEPFATRHAGSPYDGEIAAVDAAIGEIMARLRALDLYDRTLVIITADHGEGLGEHGEATHGYFIYESTLRVPLLVKLPHAREGLRSTRPAGLVDVLPTILGALGIPAPPGLQGEDLSVHPEGLPTAAEPRRLYAESLTATKFGAAPLRGLTWGRWKYILTTRPELYDLEVDARETRDLAAVEGKQAAGLNRQLERTLSDDSALRAGGSSVAPDAETRARLESLGYLAGGSVSEGLAVDPSLPDPKDLIDVHAGFQRVMELSGTGRFDEARAICGQLRTDHPTIRDLVLLAGDIELQAGAPREATALYRQFLDLTASSATATDPDLAHARYNLGNALAGSGDREGAVASYQETIRLDPDHAEARFNLAVTLGELGRVAEATVTLEELLEREPSHVGARVDLAHARVLADRSAEAVRLLDEALALDPDHAGALAQSARLLVTTDRAVEGVERYGRAIQLAPERTELVSELAWILATHPDPAARNGAEAIRLVEPLVEGSGGRDPRTLETLAAAWAEAGRFDRAAGLQKRALDLLASAPEPLRQAAQSRFDSYRQGRPFRAGP